MAARGNLLEQPVERAARVVALDLLAAAAKHRPRLNNKRNAGEALHDFRVAVRRLRSWLRAFDPWLEGSVPRKPRRRLKRAGRATNASRDADVRLVWLRAQRHDISPRDRAGLTWLMKHITEARTESFAEDMAKGLSAFDRAENKLDHTLREYRVLIEKEDEASAPAFDSVIGELMRSHARQLRQSLDQAHAATSRRRIHVARIQAKRLRYLMDPLSDIVPGVKELVDELGKLQDALGDSHDVALFAEELAELTRDAPKDPRLIAGFTAIRNRLGARADEALAQVNVWLSGDAAALLERVETIADALSPQPRPALALVQDKSTA